MSMSDISWRRSLYVCAGLSMLAVVILMIFVIPPFKKDIVPGSEWILPGIQLFMAAMFFGTGYLNRREGCLTRILLILLGVSVAILGLLGFIAPAMESEMNAIWKVATRICAIDELFIGIIAFYACL
jgi:hypothetical protein